MIRDGNYILIPSFARTELDLKGNELLLYSLIYGFSQDEKSCFTGSIGYMCEWIGATKPTVLKALKGLIEKKLIDRTESEFGPVTIIRYKAIVPNERNFTPSKETLPPGKESLPPSKESLPPSKETLPPGKESLPNNIDNNIDYKSNNKSIGDDKKRKRFIPPTLEEVAAYCRERNNTVDPQHWHDYYSSNGWKVGKNPMKDWKSAVRTWERNGFSNSNQNSKPQSRAGSAFRDIQNSRSYDYDDLQKRLGGFG